MDQRKKPFTEFERSFLINLIQQQAHVIENKKTDGVTLVKKTAAWSRVTEEFNASSRITNKADVKQLKKFWNNIKAKSREAKTKENQRNFTGGGPAIPDMDPEQAQVLSIIPKILPVIKITDSDAVKDGEGDDDDSNYWVHLKTRSKTSEIQEMAVPCDYIDEDKILPNRPEFAVEPVELSYPDVILEPKDTTAALTPSTSESRPEPSQLCHLYDVTPLHSTKETPHLKRRRYHNTDSVEDFKKQIMEQDLKNRAERFNIEKKTFIRNAEIGNSTKNIRNRTQEKNVSTL